MERLKKSIKRLNRRRWTKLIGFSTAQASIFVMFLALIKIAFNGYVRIFEPNPYILTAEIFLCSFALIGLCWDMAVTIEEWKQKVK